MKTPPIRHVVILGRPVPLQWLVVGAAVLVLLVSLVRSGLFDESPALRRSPAPAPAGQAAPAAGVGTGTAPAPRDDAGGDWPGAAVDILLKLAAVLALAYVALAALRRYTGATPLGRPGGTVKVLETTAIAPNRTLYLVRAGDRTLLLGVTPTQITTLSEWTDGDAPPSVAVESSTD